MWAPGIAGLGRAKWDCSAPDTFGYFGQSRPSQAGNPYAAAAPLRLPRSPTTTTNTTNPTRRHIMFAATARRTVLKAAGVVPRADSVFSSHSAYHRLLSTLAVLEQRDGTLNHGSLSAFTAAKKLGGSIHGFVAGNNIKPVAEQAAKVDGVDKIIAVDNAAYDKVRFPSHPRLRCFRPPVGPRR